MEVKSITLVVAEDNGRYAVMSKKGKRITKWFDISDIAESVEETKTTRIWLLWVNYAVSRLRSRTSSKTDTEIAWAKKLDSMRVSMRNRRVRPEVGEAKRTRLRNTWDESIQAMCKQRNSDAINGRRSQWHIWSTTVSGNLKKRRDVRNERHESSKARVCDSVGNKESIEAAA